MSGFSSNLVSYTGFCYRLFLFHTHDVIRDVERKKARKKRKKERKTHEAMENENESCLRWDSNPRHSVLQTDALPTELPRQPSWQGPNQASHTPV